MKIRKIILLSIVTLAISACGKKDVDVAEYDCEAIVINNLIDESIFCDKEVYTLKFIKGENKIKPLIGYEYNVTDSNYTVLNLPEKLGTIGVTIKLDIRALQTNEFPICYNFEMPIFLGPTVYIVRAEKK